MQILWCKCCGYVIGIGEVIQVNGMLFCSVSCASDWFYDRPVDEIYDDEYMDFNDA